MEVIGGLLMKDIHFACNNTQICAKRIQPNENCKAEKCKYCIETEIYVADKPERISLEW